MPEDDFTSEMRALDLADPVLFKWGRLFSADVVIHGKCQIIEGEQVTVELTALNIGKEHFVFQDAQAEGLEEGVDQFDEIIRVVERAVNKIAGRLSPAILKDVEVGDSKRSTLLLMLKGLENFKQFREFKAFLEKEVKGVQSVKQTKVRGKTIYITVIYSGEEESFLDRVLHHAKLPFQTEVSGSEEGAIVFELKR